MKLNHKTILLMEQVRRKRHKAIHKRALEIFMNGNSTQGDSKYELMRLKEEAYKLDGELNVLNEIAMLLLSEGNV